MNQFHIGHSDIPGLLTIRPHPIADDRGWFMRSFSAQEYATAGIDQSSQVQENHSRSRHGVLRGLHTRSELSEAKLVRAARGKVFERCRRPAARLAHLSAVARLRARR